MRLPTPHLNLRHLFSNRAHIVVLALIASYVLFITWSLYVNITNVFISPLSIDLSASSTQRQHLNIELLETIIDRIEEKENFSRSSQFVTVPQPEATVEETTVDGYAP